MDVMLVVEEIGFDGSVSLGKCSKSTVYRWTKAINEYLEWNKYLLICLSNIYQKIKENLLL